MKTHTYINGEPEIFKEGTIVEDICCDCNLVHLRIVKKARGGVATIINYRDDWRTKQEREKK